MPEGPGGLLSTLIGASFCDAGTLTSRFYGGTGIRLLSLLDVLRVWSNPSLLRFGDLNLVGVLNPLAGTPANPLIWGEAAAWTESEQIVWGTALRNSSGDQIVWGTWGDDQIVWGTTTLTDPDPR